VSAPSAGARGRLPVLAALAIAAVIAGGLVGLALRSDGGGDQRASSRASTTHPSPARKPKASRKAASPQPQAKASQQSGPATTSDPAALNARGFSLIQSGDYAAAVQPLRAAVQAYRDAGRTGELGYYYALFNLGRALSRSGDPEGAIAVLRERLRNPDQRDAVRRELAAATAKLGPDTQGNKVGGGRRGGG
jgi:Flp pilus assembly protein TadD